VAERRVAVVDRERDLRLAVGGDAKVLDEAALRAAYVHVVALDELAAADEARLDRVARRGAVEEHERDHRAREDNGSDRCRPRQTALTRPHLLAPLRTVDAICH
jgi:hypothetical protein